MMDSGKLAARLVAVIMVIGAVGWGAWVFRQASEMDDGGPPLGALVMGAPALGLFIGAGVVWSWTNRE